MLTNNLDIDTNIGKKTVRVYKTNLGETFEECETPTSEFFNQAKLGKGSMTNFK